jgi:hypothetical protein
MKRTGIPNGRHCLSSANDSIYGVVIKGERSEPKDTLEFRADEILEKIEPHDSDLLGGRCQHMIRVNGFK